MKDKVVQTRITKEQFKEIQSMAVWLSNKIGIKVTCSDIIRIAIENHLKKKPDV